MAKPPATAVSKNDFLASVPALGRRLFLWSFTPFHLLFRYLLPVFQDGKALGGIRRNGSKDLSQVSRRAIFVPGPRNGDVSGPVKLKSNSIGFSAVFSQRFPRWLMGSKESRRLNENGSNQGKCRGVLPRAAV